RGPGRRGTIGFPALAQSSGSPADRRARCTRPRDIAGAVRRAIMRPWLRCLLASRKKASHPNEGIKAMSTIKTKDGTEIYYKDWGKGPVVTFSHGWPLCADAWDGQMLFLAQNGFRAVAHDRRGHGRSSQASSGNDMNGYADDLAAVIEALDLSDATLVGHSTGGGEVARYVARHGTKRVV